MADMGAPLTGASCLGQVLRLAASLVTHPFFEHAPSDGWIWERLLEQSAANLLWEPAAALPWAAVAARCAERAELGSAMLRSDRCAPCP